MAVGSFLLIGPAPEAEDPIGRISLGGSGGYSSYQLSDVNDRVKVGNDFLDERGWTSMDQLGFGWSFWADIMFPVPRLDFLFISGGYGTTSGSTGGLDYNELITVAVSQKAYHARLLYVLPFRFHENIRLFVGGGPLFIQEQELRATHTRRTSQGGGSGTETHERTEEVFYRGSGTGWQFGIAAEYMVQDHLTFCMDLGYRWADVTSADWTAADNVLISDTGPAEFSDGTTTLERLDYENSYILRGFLDENATMNAKVGDEIEYGPHFNHLRPVPADDLGINLSGIQIQLGLRFYFL
jgi:opacity protein-like surface antigen